MPSNGNGVQGRVVLEAPPQPGFTLLPQLPEPATPPPTQDSLAIDLVERSDLFDRYTYCASQVLHRGTTAYQSVIIADTVNYGRALFLDDAIQSAEDDEEVYHELLVHPAMLAHPDPRDVLIIGGGEGAALREVLRYQSVRSATMVDLDGEVVELCRTHLPSWHCGAFEDPRTHLVIRDGREFVEEGDHRYDVVIVDVVDMFDNGPAQALYTRQFYQQLRRRLQPGALVAIQGMEFSFLDHYPHAALSRTLRTAFSEVHSYRMDIPSFLSSWGFMLASDWCAPAQWSAAAIDQQIGRRLVPDDLQHLTGEFLMSRFSLCKATRALLVQSGPLLEDGVRFVSANGAAA